MNLIVNVGKLPLAGQLEAEVPYYFGKDDCR